MGYHQYFVISRRLHYDFIEHTKCPFAVQDFFFREHSIAFNKRWALLGVISKRFPLFNFLPSLIDCCQAIDSAQCSVERLFWLVAIQLVLRSHLLMIDVGLLNFRYRILSFGGGGRKKGESNRRNGLRRICWWRLG